MSMVVTITRPTKVEAESRSDIHWIKFREGGNCVAVICPNAEVAQATAAAWNDAMGYSQAEVDHEPA